MEEKKRNRRSKEEIVAELDNKIAYHKNCIVQLEEKKAKVLAPRTRKKSLTAKQILDFAKSEGISLKEIADKIGFVYEEN